MTLVSLRRALSANGGVSEKVADDFLSALVKSIQDGLVKDGSVTINGMGTFKLQDVPARESVNVTTGERFTIAGYKKVVFVEGTSSTTRTKKTDEPIDPIQKLGEQAEEIKDILSELNAMSTEQTVPSTETTEQAETPKAPKKAKARKAAKVAITPEAPQAQESQEAPVTPAPPQTKPVQEQTKKPFNPWLTGLITIGVFAMLLIIAYFVLRHQIVSWADGMRTNIEQRVNTPEDNFVQSTEPAEQTESASTEQTEETVSDNTIQPEPTPALPSFYYDEQRVFTEFQATETVGQDSRLAWVAWKHYGEKAMWVFVYEANRDRLKDPNQVLPGMQLRIPKLPKELRDVNNPDTKELLERLSDKYLGGR